MTSLGRWKSDSEYALRFILTLGDAKTQRDIFGDNFNKVMLALDAPAAMTANLPGTSTTSGQSVSTGHATSSSTAPAGLNKVNQPGLQQGSSARASWPSTVGSIGPTGGITTSSAHGPTALTVISKSRASLPASNKLGAQGVSALNSAQFSAVAGPSAGEKRAAPSDAPPAPKKKAKIRSDIPVIELSD